jgi:opacity protein-like surface antigen
VWSYGVFIYPPPPRPVMIVESTTVATTSAPEPEIDRSVDRSRSFSVGLRGGSYLSGYHEGPGFGDFGMGVAARYRAAEALGFEVAWLYHDNTWTRETERISQPLSASVELFAFPWTRFNPYVFTGVTWTSRNYHDQIGVGPNAGMTVDVEDSLFGPHGGLGLEFGVGQNASVNLETRFIGYLNKEETDISRAGALQANLGFNFYF